MTRHLDCLQVLVASDPFPVLLQGEEGTRGNLGCVDARPDHPVHPFGREIASALHETGTGAGIAGRPHWGVSCRRDPPSGATSRTCTAKEAASFATS